MSKPKTVQPVDPSGEGKPEQGTAERPEVQNVKYEVCITIMEPYTPEVRMPGVETQSSAEALAQAAAAAYPTALIEIAHNGLRTCHNRRRGDRRPIPVQPWGKY
jgi:hypothetical protein